MSTVKADYLVNAAGTGAPTLTNGAVLPAGSAAAPAISPTGDSNTGVFFPAADTVALSTAGTQRVTVDSVGSVGIGTTSPGASLDINGSAFVRGAGAEGGEIAFFNVDRTIVGLTVDVSSANVGRIFQTQNNSILQLGQLGGTGGTISLYTAATERMHIDASGNLKFNSGYGSAAIAYGCRAWVIFAGASGTVAGSGNVTSVSRAAAGNYTINFTNAMPDANYCITGVSSGSSTGSTSISAAGASGDFSRSTGSVQVFSVDASGNANVDAVTVCVAIFR
jgi:hypothetical protein